MKRHRSIAEHARRCESASCGAGRVDRRRAAGTSMIEMVLALPFLFLILGLSVYFGIATLRSTKATMLARYETQRQTVSAPGPLAAGADVRQPEPEAEPAPGDWSDETILSTDPPDRVARADPDAFPLEAMVRLTFLVEDRDANAEGLASALRFALPAGVSGSYFTEYDPINGLARRFERPLIATVSLADGPWRYTQRTISPDYDRWFDPVEGQWFAVDDRPPRGNIVVYDALRATHLLPFVEALGDLLRPTNPNPLADMLNSFLSLPPAYRGPTVETRFGEEE